MNKDGLFWIKAGAVLGAIAVVCGSFGAHMLPEFLMEKYAGQTREVLGQQIPAAQKYLADFKTAAEYEMYHSLALLAVGLLSLHGSSWSLRLAGRSFLFGSIIFSGSLYLLVLTGMRWLGAVTPFGGVLFIIGWAALFYATMQMPRSTSAA
ncbi:DUF423 domain-containing protein [Planctomicrobium piriforme]|uniref:Uncharacterized membrane protein YgdD, TMEM256/DUF423 family n=1 Tax=Planctomicrobium piriforme TaxID=1576369 RepID=A0A1I3QKA5_9PLAN|nr:DUF423 domain-containing protein [Planctomicrobium piriforme]SFJ34185.1 Uncharacterized membrane protein YgdD, TMEM256/DUF423 family [Planctomicrobium piriforme]